MFNNENECQKEHVIFRRCNLCEHNTSNARQQGKQQMVLIGAFSKRRLIFTSHLKSKEYITMSEKLIEFLSANRCITK